MYRSWTSNGRIDSKDNSDDYKSNDTICSMYINDCFKRYVLFSLFLPHTVVNVFSGITY